MYNGDLQGFTQTNNRTRIDLVPPNIQNLDRLEVGKNPTEMVING